MVRIFFCWIFLALPCVATEPYTPTSSDPMLEPWRLRHEEMLDGYGVLCMAEAVDGSLWFGGTEGVVHYDGMELVPIPFGDEFLSRIKARDGTPRVKALLALENGDLLALVEDSLALLSDGGWEVVIYDAGSSVFTCKLARSPDGAFWLLVPEGLWRVSSDLKEVSKVLSVSKPQALSSFCFDDSGDVWYAKGLEEGRRSKLVRIPLENGVPKPRSEWRGYRAPEEMKSKWAVIAAGAGGLIWYADRTANAGFRAFDPATDRWVKRGSRTSKVSVHSMATARDGTVWGGAQGQLCRIGPDGTETVYSREDLLLPQLPFSLCETSDGRLWVIGRIGFVYSMDLSDEVWMTYEKLNFQCETADRVQWFIEQGGAAVSYDPRSEQWLRHGPEDGMIDAPDALVASSHGLVWAAGSHEGGAAIAVHGGAGWTRLPHPEFATRIEPNAVFEARDGTLWFGAGGRHRDGDRDGGGALQYEVGGQGDVRLRARHGRPVFPYFQLCFAETEEAFWVGSTTVLGYDIAARAKVVELEEPRNNTVDMVVDGQGALWLAKEHLGVFQRQGEGWRKFTTEDGLASLLVADLLLLGDGSLLVSSDKGISRFDGKRWATQPYLEHFGMSKRWSGMREASDGSLWFNFATGEVPAAPRSGSLSRELYRTTRHRPETLPPQTRIREHVERVSQPGNCRIDWLALDPWGQTPQEHMQYSWRLNGGEWSEYTYETGRTFLDLPHGGYALEARSRDQAFNVDPTPARVEFVVVAPLWIQPWFVAMLSFFVGMILLLVWMIVRIRERALVRQQEAREEHLLEMDQLKTGFFTNISHELRTPLTVILGPLQTLLAQEQDEQKRSMLASMVSNGNRMANLITQLLDLRKLERKKVMLEVTEDDLPAFLADVVVSLKPLAAEKRIAFRFDEPSPCRGWFDPDNLQKIVTNLISNAIKYTADGGQVKVKMTVEADERRHRWAVLSIEDNGSGIDAEHLLHVFERFYRVPESRIIDGSGIGLNLTQELVALSGGTIRAESPIYEDAARPGTRFLVRLPIDREGLPADAVSVSRREDWDLEAGPAAPGETALSPDLAEAGAPCEDAPLLLLVEDDAEIRSYVSRELGGRYRLEVAVDGGEGLERACRLVPDLVVTDLMMPVMGGVELCRELKARLETSHIPVVMLTAKGSLESRIEGLETGADDYVTKPFHMSLLKARIHNLLESRRKLRERYSQELSESMQAQEGALAQWAPPQAASPRDQEFMEKASSLLDENVADPEFTIERFASALNMSERSLRRRLKAVTDRSPVSFVLAFRLRKAAFLLDSSSATITEIAFAVGFSDSGHFSKQFRKEYGKSPSQFRARETA